MTKVGRPVAIESDYAPTMHQVLSLIEGGLSSTQAAARVNRSRHWVWRLVRKSRHGEAMGWIASEWDRIRANNRRCDLCSSPIANGDMVPHKDGVLHFEFCGDTCKAHWLEGEVA